MSTDNPQNGESNHDWIVTKEEAGQRLDQAIAAHLPTLSRTRIQKLIQAGDVQLNRKPSTSSHAVRVGNKITVAEPPPEAATPQPESIPLEIVFEDDDLIVIDKAAGMAVHPGRGISSGTMVNALLGRTHSISTIGGVLRPGIVHRLDKDTTGLIMVAKNDQTHIALSEALQSRKVTRLYVALVLRRFDTDRGTIEASIGRNQSNRLKMSVREGHDVKDARTHWRMLERFGGISQIECKLDTGRTHQIRVHMSYTGHPLLGDILYGGTAALAMQFVSPYDTQFKAVIKDISRQMLHAHELKFVHPKTGEAMHFKSAPPADYQAVLTRLRAAVNEDK